MSVTVTKGIDVQFPNGHTEHVDCGVWWVVEGVLHTDKIKIPPTVFGAGYTLTRGPSFSLANVKRCEPTR